MRSSWMVAISGQAALHLRDPQAHAPVDVPKAVQWDDGCVSVALFNTAQGDSLLSFAVRGCHTLETVSLSKVSHWHGAISCVSADPFLVLFKAMPWLTGAPGDAEVLASVAWLLRDFIDSENGRVLQCTLRALPESRGVVFTGFALGGVLAQLFMLFAVETGLLAPGSPLPRPRLLTYTFGKPQTGNLSFARFLNSRVWGGCNFYVAEDTTLQFIAASCLDGDGIPLLHPELKEVLLDACGGGGVEGAVDEAGVGDSVMQAAYQQRLSRLLVLSPPLRAVMSPRQHSLHLHSARVARFLRGVVRSTGLRACMQRVAATLMPDSRDHSESFDELAARYRDQQLVRIVGEVLNRVVFLCFRARVRLRFAHRYRDEKISVRFFLAAFMIHEFPNHCFQAVDTLERQVIETAGRLVEGFRSICGRVLRDGKLGPTLRDWGLWSDFPDRLSGFFSVIESWQAPNSMNVRNSLKHSLLALCHAERHVASCEDHEEEMRVRVAFYKRALCSQIQQTCGDEDIEEVSRELEEAGFPGAIGTCFDRVAAQRTLPGSIPCILDPPASFNRHVMRGLLLDPGFRLPDSSNAYMFEPAGMQEIRHCFRQAFWSNLADDIEGPCPRYQRVVDIMKSSYHDVVECFPSARQELEKRRIPARLEVIHNTWESSVSLLRDMVPVVVGLVEHHRRGRELARWRELKAGLQAAADRAGRGKALCNVLQYLVEVRRLIKVDIANRELELAPLRLRAAVLVREKMHFEEAVMGKPRNVAVVYEWLRRTVMEEARAGRVDLWALMRGDEASVLTLHAHAVFALVTGFSDSERRVHVPHSLGLDLYRFRRLFTELRMQIVATVIVEAAERSLRPRWSARAERVVAAMKEYFLRCRLPLRVRSSSLRETIFSGLVEALGERQKQALLQLFPGCGGLMAILEGLWGPLEEARMQVESAWRSLISPAGPGVMPEHWMQERIEASCDQLRRIVELDREICIGHYRGIIMEAGRSACPCVDA